MSTYSGQYPLVILELRCFSDFLGGFEKTFSYTKSWDLSLSLWYSETYFSMSVWYFQLNFSPKHKGLRLLIKLNTGPTALSILLVFCVMLKGTSSCLKLAARFCDWSVWWHKVQTVPICHLLFSHINTADFRLDVPFIFQTVCVF